MKKEYDINHIKSLLEAYYDGATTIEQEQLLCDFFASATEIPAELEADRLLFNSLQTAGFDNHNTPDDLEEQLISLIDNLEKAEQVNKQRLIKPFAYISVVASLIILFVIGFNLISFDDKINNQNIELITNIDEDSVDIKEQYDTIPSINSHIDQSHDEEKSRPAIIQKKKQVKKHRTIRTNQLKSVNDEQIAYENTEKALLLLSEKLNKAQESINKTEATINDINNTIIDII